MIYITTVKELKEWENILKSHENELKELQKPYDVTKVTTYDIDKRIERIMFLEQSIIEDKIIINDIKINLIVENELLPCEMEFKGEILFKGCVNCNRCDKND